MSRKVRALRRNMLIVCEGEVTEPEYFAVLRRMAIETEIWAEVEIRPKPRSDIEEDIPSPHKSARKKRSFKTVSIPEEADNIEQHYPWRQTPVNYVKEARGGLKDDVFEEVWAVYDRNGHPAHEQAFNLALEPVNGNIVNIAFSSVAFEHWILLHFERNSNAFVKSECKEAQHYLECGLGRHPNDCWGDRCISGCLRVNQYITGSTKIQDEEFQKLLGTLVEPEFRGKAYENAAWLRHTVPHDQAKPYLTNPYTNMDSLVKRLLGEEDYSIEWARFGQVKDWQSLSIQVDIEDNYFRYKIANLGTATRLYNSVDISVFSSKGDQKTEWIPVNAKDRIISVNGDITFFTQPIDNILEMTLEIKTGTHWLMISA